MVDAPDARAFVLDTSVLVHDPNALFTFRDTTVVVPIYVIMELDELKTSRRQEVAASARAASRHISALMEHGSLHGNAGVLHPELGTRFFVWASDQGPGVRALRGSTTGRKIDVHILTSAISFRDNHPDKDVVLLSKDVNLRILANFEGIAAEDYDRDRVQLASVSTGFRYLDGYDSAGLQSAFVPDQELTADQFELTDLSPNEFVVFRDEAREFAFRYEARDGTLRPIPKDFRRLAGVSPRNAEQRMALSLLTNPDIELVTLIGKAGTGKTFLALAAGLAQLTYPGADHGYQRLILSKPVVPMGNDIGFLPGDFDEEDAALDGRLSTTRSAHPHRRLHRQGQGREPLGEGLGDPLQQRPDRGAGHPLDPRPLHLGRVHRDRRGAEPHAPRGEDDHHPRGERHEGRARRRPLPGRQPFLDQNRTASSTSPSASSPPR